MSKQILKPERRERGTEYDKKVFWNNIKLGEITDERLVRIMNACHSNSTCYTFMATIRNGKMVMEIYGDDVPDDFKQMLEAIEK
jgi:hypothetical protein